MIFKFYGIDTNLQEILYYSGIGYSLAYSKSKKNGRLKFGYILSQTSIDRSFLADLFGLTYEFCYPDTEKLNDEECWQEYWHEIKKNILDNVPIIVNVNPLLLPSFRKLIGLPKWVSNLFPSLIIHSIIIIGFNESDNMVCYHDPAAAIGNKSQNGKYLWMNLNDFKKAISTVKRKEDQPKYLIEIFKKNKIPLSKKDALKCAHERNLEKMQGNKNSYAKIYRYKNEIGLKALEALREDLNSELSQRLKIIRTYRHIGKRLNLLSKFTKLFPAARSSNYNPFTSFYSKISTEKLYTYQYLNNNYDSLKLFKNEILLLNEEIKIWNSLELNFLKFSKKVSLNKNEALEIIEKIKNQIDKIIKIEKEIINL
jgi:hypothetical protein